MENSAKTNILTFINELREKIVSLSFSNGSSFLGSAISPKNPELFSIARFEEILSSTSSILIKVYGDQHQQMKDFIEKNTYYRKHITDKEQKLLNYCLGKLSAVESDIKFGFLQTAEREISGEVFGDFIKAAKASFDEDYKEVAVVLACAALEDLLKRLAKLNSLDVQEKTMSEVVNALKREGLIKGAQTNLVSAFVTLRNKTFHAQWDKIEKADIASLIGFTEEMLIKHFT